MATASNTNSTNDAEAAATVTSGSSNAVSGTAVKNGTTTTTTTEDDDDATDSDDLINEMNKLAEAKDRGQLSSTSAMSLVNVGMLEEVIRQGSGYSMYAPLIALLSVSITLQIIAGILGVMVSNMKSSTSSTTSSMTSQKACCRNCPATVKCCGRKQAEAQTATVVSETGRDGAGGQGEEEEGAATGSDSTTKSSKSKGTSFLQSCCCAKAAQGQEAVDSETGLEEMGGATIPERRPEGKGEGGSTGIGSGETVVVVGDASSCSDVTDCPEIAVTSCDSVMAREKYSSGTRRYTVGQPTVIKAAEDSTERIITTATTTTTTNNNNTAITTAATNSKTVATAITMATSSTMATTTTTTSTVADTTTPQEPLTYQQKLEKRMNELMDEMLEMKESLLESKMMLPYLEERIEQCKSKMNQIEEDEKKTADGATSADSSLAEGQKTSIKNAEYAAAKAELATLTNERDKQLEVQRYCDLQKAKFQVYKKMASQAQQKETVRRLMFWQNVINYILYFVVLLNAFITAFTFVEDAID